MAATLELKYFNSFWLKKLESIVNVQDSVKIVEDALTGQTTMTFPEESPAVGVGQAVNWVGMPEEANPVVLYVEAASSTVTVTVTEPITADADTAFSFGPIADFSHIQNAYQGSSYDWFIEESRIRGGYANTDVDLGVKAYIVEPNASQQHLSNSIIYSGIFNSRTGVNNTNQFSVAEDITRAVDPSQGTIQKLYAEDTNLIIFQEKKVSRALIDKDAIYSAEGQPMTTSGAQVIGQVQQYAGNYGIGTNPESFAVYGYRKYFADRTQNVVLRLSQDGITEISSYGMLDYFRDNLSAVGNDGKVIGSWDMHNKQYVISMQPTNTLNYATLSFDEDVNGWTSLFSFKPELGGSLLNNYYTFKDGGIWKHYADPASSNVPYATFYGTTYDSNITAVLNGQVSTVKNFNTINYEGSAGWRLVSLYTNTDNSFPIGANKDVTNLADLENQLFENNFIRKEDKFFANIINNTTAGFGDVIYGKSMSGIKGFYATAKFSFDNTPILLSSSPTEAKSVKYPKAELFATSLEYVESSY
jgi:hypothetical protein